MGKPEVPIEVDEATGIWTVDGMPMVLVPRHFLVNTHRAREAAIGIAASARMSYEAGHKSAWAWCDKEAKTHGLTGLEVFHHYMRRLSQRGWGQFKVVELDAATGHAVVDVAHSIFVAELGPGQDRRLCYALEGWFVGSLEWVSQSLGRSIRLVAREVSCAAHEGGEHCRFEIVPAPTEATR
jgi:predicted hydrocarbon binding protein